MSRPRNSSSSRASRFILSTAPALSAQTRVATTLPRVSVPDNAPCTSPSLTAPSLIWRMKYLRQQAAQARTLSTSQPRSSCSRVCATHTSRQQFCNATRVFKGRAGSCALAQRTASTRGAACCATCSARQARTSATPFVCMSTSRARHAPGAVTCSCQRALRCLRSSDASKRTLLCLWLSLTPLHSECK